MSDKKTTSPYYIRFFHNFEGKILDVGCGIGKFISLDRDNIIVIDVDKKAVSKVNNRGFNCILMNIEGNISIKNNSLECVHASQIIEHLEKPFEAMKEFYRILKPGGLLLLAVPDAKK